MGALRKYVQQIFGYKQPQPLIEGIAKGRDVSDVALLVIDVQKAFCDPRGSRGTRETADISERIASIVPEFRKAGVAVYAIYFDSSMCRNVSQVDWFKFTPANTDIPVAKNDDSAFAGSNIASLLRQNHHHKLIACGFNLSFCVKDTILDAREEGFEVALMRDLSTNGICRANNPPQDIRTFRENGIDITTSREALDAVQSTLTHAAEARRPPKPGFPANDPA